MKVQQIIHGMVCDVNTRIIISPTNKVFKKSAKRVVSKTIKHVMQEKDDDYYCGECAEDDLDHR